jgi:hypothetical protein
VRVSLAVVRVAYTARAVRAPHSFGVGASAYRPAAPLDRAIAATTEQVSVGDPGIGSLDVGRDEQRTSETLI